MRKQKGITLILAIALLMVLTMVALTSLEVTLGQEKIGFNQRDIHLAFNSAESGLREGELWLKAQLTKPTAVSTCASAPCDVWTSGSIAPLTESGSWWGTQAKTYSGNIEHVNTLPQFVIQEMMVVPFEMSPEALAQGQGYHYYRVTARGTGSEVSTVVILESIFAVEFN